MRNSFFVVILTVALWLKQESLFASGTGQPPRVSITNLTYAGAFRLPAREFGESSLNYSQGPLAFNPDRQSIFIVGHAHHQAIAEFKVPEVVNSMAVDELKMAEVPVQHFTRVLDRAPDGNPEGNNRIGGLLYLPGNDSPVLLVNAYEYYDAPGDNRSSMLVLEDALNLASSKIKGFFAVQGGPGHTAGWMSPIPTRWQERLGGSYLTGHSGGIPIISRCSVGPSAFVFSAMEVAALEGTDQIISTTCLLDFSLAHPLADDLSNNSRTNRLWNHLSRAVYGIILPDTSTYATFGFSGGHESGVGYKNLRDDGSRSGGYSSYAVKDNYPYYWLWDVDDLVDVKEGRLQPHAVRPYEYGVLKTPYNDFSDCIGGGTFDPASGKIYLSLNRADSKQGQYACPPVILVYKLNSDILKTR